MKERALVLAPIFFVAGAYLAVPNQQSLVAAPLPTTMHYQGRLTDSNGQPLEGQVAKLTFKLYGTPAPSVASLAWGEVHENVPVSRGVFSVLLGAGTKALDVSTDPPTESPGSSPLGALVFDGSPRFIQVQVNDEPPLLPLIPLASVPYAIMAGAAQTLIDPTGGDPVSLEGLVRTVNGVSASATGDFTVQGRGGVEVSNLANGLRVAAGRVIRQIQVDMEPRKRVLTVSTPIPHDETIPQINEGVEVLSVPFTPLHPDSSVFLFANVQPRYNGGHDSMVSALFDSEESNALAATCIRVWTAEGAHNMVLTHYVERVGDVLPREYTVRSGQVGNPRVQLNACGNGEGMGNVGTTMLMVVEVAPE